MKYLQTINEYKRTVGFRYSDPKESYTIEVLCKGIDITKDKINSGLSKVSDLFYDAESIQIHVFEEETILDLENTPTSIDALVKFNINVYNEKEILTIIEELDKKLSDFGIQLVDFKSKENF